MAIHPAALGPFPAPEIQQRAPAYAAPLETCGAAPRAPHIPDETDRLSSSVSELSALVSQLADRLAASVVSPFPVNANESGLDTYRVPVAEAIRTERRRIQGLIETVSNLLNNLEL